MNQTQEYVYNEAFMDELQKISAIKMPTKLLKNVSKIFKRKILNTKFGQNIKKQKIRKEVYKEFGNLMDDILEGKISQ